MLLQFIVIFSSSISQRSSLKYDLFEIIVLYITLSTLISVNNTFTFTFLLPTVYMPPGHNLDFIK